MGKFLRQFNFRKHFFGEIKNGEIILNESGMIANNEWLKISKNKFGTQSINAASIIPGFKSSVTTFARKNSINFNRQKNSTA